MVPAEGCGFAAPLPKVKCVSANVRDLLIRVLDQMPSLDVWLAAVRE